MLRRLSFFCSITTIYILTIGTIGALLYSSHLFGVPVWAAQQSPPVQKKIVPLPPKTTSGKPIRIIIENPTIDLPVSDGVYDPSTQGWTLNPEGTQFATISAPANDQAGITFIYGHGTDTVFGKLGANHPPLGTVAQIYTDNGYVFSYKLQGIRDYNPTDTSILQDTTSGPSRLVVQTCTGIFSEWRTMFTFIFEKVDKQ